MNVNGFYKEKLLTEISLSFSYIKSNFYIFSIKGFKNSDFRTFVRVQMMAQHFTKKICNRTSLSRGAYMCQGMCPLFNVFFNTII